MSSFTRRHRWVSLVGGIAVLCRLGYEDQLLQGVHDLLHLDPLGDGVLPAQQLRALQCLPVSAGHPPPFSDDPDDLGR